MHRSYVSSQRASVIKKANKSLRRHCPHQVVLRSMFSAQSTTFCLGPAPPLFYLWQRYNKQRKPPTLLSEKTFNNLLDELNRSPGIRQSRTPCHPSNLQVINIKSVVRINVASSAAYPSSSERGKFCTDFRNAVQSFAPKTAKFCSLDCKFLHPRVQNHGLLCLCGSVPAQFIQLVFNRISHHIKITPEI